MGLRERFARFMAGRYGRDQLNTLLSVVCIVLLIINMIFGNSIILFLAILSLVFLYFRTFSRNYAARYAENQKYLAIRSKLFGGFTRKKAQFQDKDHAYFKCPKCKKTLRVPKGRGRIQIHCPKCGTDFIEKT